MPEAFAGMDRLGWRSPRTTRTTGSRSTGKCGQIYDGSRLRGRCFDRALIGTYKHLKLGDNLALSDFSDWLLHGCTAPRYKFRSKRRVSGEGIDCAARNGLKPGGLPSLAWHLNLKV